MKLTALTLLWASVLVLADRATCLPFCADIEWIILEKVWLAAEVLPVMSVDTLCSIMVSVKWTPLCFEVKHIEFLCSRHLMDKWRLNINIRVGKRTKLLVITALRILGTKLSLVFLDVVQTFNFIMREFTVLVAAAFRGTGVDAVVEFCGTASTI